jgi:hypothetical protein
MKLFPQQSSQPCVKNKINNSPFGGFSALTIMSKKIIAAKEDNHMWVAPQKKVRYKQKKKKKFNILFMGELQDDGKPPIIWPKNLPKDFKLKGKNYIHYAAEKCDMVMLNKAIADKHDLARHDSFGKNAFYYLFNNTSSELINIEFFKKILSINKDAWKPINTVDLLAYFANKIKSTISTRKKIVYNKEVYDNIMFSYKEFMNVVKQYNLAFYLVTKHFCRIQFNSTIQAELIEEALLAAYNKEKCLINLIERVNFFSTPIIHNKEKDIPFLTILDDFGYYSAPLVSGHSVSNHMIMMGTTRMGMGKSFLSMEMLGLEINKSADQDILFQMWKNYILKHENLHKLVMSNDLFSILQKYNKTLANNLIKDDLENELGSQTVKKEARKMKI